MSSKIRTTNRSSEMFSCDGLNEPILIALNRCTFESLDVPMKILDLPVSFEV
jgi:hypothetical protein